MKKLLFVGLLAALSVAFAKTSTPAGWTDDYDAALKRAAAENKYIVADFSGSDWCGWCKRLDHEVFDTEVFRKGAKDKYILLMIDSPSDTDLLSEKAKKQNPALVEKYGIQGFPTVLVLDAKGETVAKLGYEKGGPENYLKLLDSNTDPDVIKYIKPIEDLLNAPDDAMEKDARKVQEEVAAKYPMEGPFKQDKMEERQMNFMKACQEAYFTKVFAKYKPIYDKAFAEAQAMKVPANVEAKKQELIGRQKENYDMMKQAYEEFLKSRENTK